MNIIDTIKEFENVGFTRKQAEQQVKVMVDLKENLATKDDLMKGLQEIRNDIRSITITLNEFKGKFNLIDGKFDLINGGFDSIDGRFELINKRFDLQDKRIDFIPFKTTIYIASVLLLFMGLSRYIPEFKQWFLFLL